MQFILQSLGALACFSLGSQGLAWKLITAYSHMDGASLHHLGLLSASGAIGLAIGQCINLSLLFKIGSHKMVSLASVILLFLYIFTDNYSFFSGVLLARLTLGCIDGMIFMVIENALILYSPPSFRSTAISAYLFTLYAMALFAPILGQYLFLHDFFTHSIVFVGIILAPIVFLGTPSFLKRQESTSTWTLYEWTFIRQGLMGSLLCALSGFLTPLWTAFIFKVVKSYAGLETVLATAFVCGGLMGQVSIYFLSKIFSSLEISRFFLIIGGVSSLSLLVLPFYSAPLFGGLLVGLAFSLYPLYGLGIDLALTNVLQEQSVRANRTFLSCYTVPAIISPLLFPLYPFSPQFGLPFLSGLCMLGAAMITYKSTYFPQKINNANNMGKI